MMLSNPPSDLEDLSLQECSQIPSEKQLRSDLSFITSMLIKLGMEAPLSILEGEDAGSEWGAGRRMQVGQATTVLIPLLQTKLREQAFRAEVEDKVQRLAEDLQESSTTLARQKAKSNDLERQVHALREELKASQKHCADLEKANIKARDENTRLKSAFQLKEKQFIHELRKREHEFDRLKEQLQTHFNKEILSGTGIDRAELARLSHSHTEHNHRLSIYGEMVPEEEFGEPGEEPLVDRLGGLEAENELMRTLLLSIQSLLQELGQVLELDAPEQQRPVLEAAVAGMPAEWVVEELKEEIEASLAALSTRVAQICGIPL